MRRLLAWIGIRLAVFAAFVVIWQGLILWFAIPHYLVPTPAGVAHAASKHIPVLLARTGFTIGTAALGLAISGTLALGLSLLFTNAPRLAKAATPLLIVFRAAPVPAIAPLIMLAVGRGMGTSIIVVMIVAFFPLYVNVMRGLSAPDPNAVQLMLVTGASRWQQMRLVRIPYALPYLFTGLRIAGASAILGAMLSEWITGAPGLGMLILNSGDMRETELLWAAVIVSVLVALCVFWTTSALERSVLAWRV